MLSVEGTSTVWVNTVIRGCLIGAVIVDVDMLLGGFGPAGGSDQCGSGAGPAAGAG